MQVQSAVAVCPWCGFKVSLRADGKFNAHVWLKPTYLGYEVKRCHGSGKLPIRLWRALRNAEEAAVAGGNQLA